MASRTASASAASLMGVMVAVQRQCFESFSFRTSVAPRATCNTHAPLETNQGKGVRAGAGPVRCARASPAAQSLGQQFVLARIKYAVSCLCALTSYLSPARPRSSLPSPGSRLAWTSAKLISSRSSPAAVLDKASSAPRYGQPTLPPSALCSPARAAGLAPALHCWCGGARWVWRQL